MKRFGKITGFIFILVFGITIIGATSFAASEQEELIQKGVYVGNIDVSGMTAQEAETELNDYLSDLKNSTFLLKGAEGSFQATASEMGVTADIENAVKEAVGAGHTGNLIERFKETKQIESGKYVVDMNLCIDRQKTAEMIAQHKPEMDIEAVDNGLKRENGQFVYIEGQSGREINVVESVYAIEDFLKNKWEKSNTMIELVVEDIKPRGSREEMAEIKDVLGSFSTNYASSSGERAKNVRNGCEKINGAILYPDEVFSVYETVSPFTKENGYELAGSYVNGTTVESFGGGICQVSTTLYNAAILAELKIEQRYNHSMIVTYVEPSMDAAIAGTYKDLKIRNTYDTPIYIEGYCDGARIFFNIYGKETRPEGREVSFESETLEKTEADTEIKLDENLPLGTVSTTQAAHTGYVARLWKIVKVNGVEESREIFNRSTYKMSPKKIVVGTKGAKEEQISALKKAADSKDEDKVKSAAEAAVKENEKEEEGDDKNTDKKPGDGSEGTDQKPDSNNQTGQNDQTGTSDNPPGETIPTTPTDPNEPTGDDGTSGTIPDVDITDNNF